MNKETMAINKQPGWEMLAASTYATAQLLFFLHLKERKKKRFWVITCRFSCKNNVTKLMFFSVLDTAHWPFHSRLMQKPSGEILESARHRFGLGGGWMLLGAHTVRSQVFGRWHVFIVLLLITTTEDFKPDDQERLLGQFHCTESSLNENN